MNDGGDFTAQASLPPEPAAPARARAFMREALRAEGLPDEVVDDAVLLVSELVANGVQHAGTGLEVTCRKLGSALEVRVTDRHPARALPDAPSRPGDPESERGRGLLLPSALAAAWGVTYTADAKTVWFVLQVSAGAQASADLQASAGAPDLGSNGPDEAGNAVAAEAGLLEAGLRWHKAGNGPAVAPGTGAAAAGDGHGRPHRELGHLGFDELVRRTVEAARDAVMADAAYALIADEDGELRVRGTVGVAVPEALTEPPGAVMLPGKPGTEQRRARSQLSVPFLVDGRVAGVLGVGAAAAAAFSQHDAARLQHVADRAAMSLERLRLSELERVRRGRIAFLTEASELLSSVLDQRQAIALTAQLVVPRLAAWCVIFLTGSLAGSSGDPGELRPEYVWHEDESRIDALSSLLDEIAPPSLARMMAGHGSTWSLAVPPGASPEMARMASDAAWCFPLTARGRGLGAVVIGRPRGDRRWPDPPPRESLELAEDLTRRAALALDNARLYERQRATSQALQHTLLPPELPSIPGIELAAEYEAAGEANDVGGDFYDAFPVSPGAWRFAIGDVSGTGPEAAAVTGLARHTLRILATEGHGITEVVDRLNRLILREGPRGRFITLLHGEIRVPGAGPATLSLVCAGHPLPLLLRNAGSGQPTEELPVPVAGSQPLLGVLDDVSYQADEMQLYPGDVLLSVTDGVTERRDDAGRLLDDDEGLAKVLATCRGLSAWAVGSRIRRAVSEFGSEPFADDMAILVLRAADPPR